MSRFQLRRGAFVLGLGESPAAFAAGVPPHRILRAVASVGLSARTLFGATTMSCTIANAHHPIQLQFPCPNRLLDSPVLVTWPVVSLFCGTPHKPASVFCDAGWAKLPVLCPWGICQAEFPSCSLAIKQGDFGWKFQDCAQWCCVGRPLGGLSLASTVMLRLSHHRWRVLALDGPVECSSGRRPVNNRVRRRLVPPNCWVMVNTRAIRLFAVPLLPVWPTCTAHCSKISSKAQVASSAGQTARSPSIITLTRVSQLCRLLRAGIQKRAKSGQLKVRTLMIAVADFLQGN